MGIRFLCPTCGHRLNVKTFLAGKRGVCPQCNHGLDIPWESQITKTRKGGIASPADVEDDDVPEQVLSAPHADSPNVGVSGPAQKDAGAVPTDAASMSAAQVNSIGAGTPSFGQAEGAERGARRGPEMRRVETPPSEPRRLETPLGEAQPVSGPTTSLEPVVPTVPIQPALATPQVSGAHNPTVGNASLSRADVAGAQPGVPMSVPMTAPASVPVGTPGVAGVPAVPMTPTSGRLAPVPAPLDPIDESPQAIWYVRPPSGGQYGPARGEVMRKWLGEGRVSPDSLVWREGWQDWKMAAEVFASLGAIVTPPMPAPLVPSAYAGHGGAAYAASAVRQKRRTSTAMAVTVVIVLGLLCIVLFITLILALMR